MAVSTSQYEALGYEFYVNTSEGEGGTVYVYSPGGYGQTASLTRLTGETAESLAAAGYTVTETTNEQLNAQGYASIGSEDFSDLAGLETYTQSLIDYIGTEASVQEGETVSAGGVDYSRDVIDAILGYESAFSQETAEATAAANTAVADAAAAEMDASTVTAATTTSSSAGQSTQSAGQQGEGLDIQQQADGTYSVVGADSGTVYASGLATIADALTQQQELGSGYVEPATTTETGATTAETSTSTAVDAELAAEVEAVDPGLIANEDYINALFEAYFGTDATQSQLDEYTGLTTGSALEAVQALARTTSLNTTDVTTTTGENVSTGDRLLTPSEYESLRTQLGVSEANFDLYFKRSDSGDIYLRSDWYENTQLSTSMGTELDAGSISGLSEDQLQDFFSTLSSGLSNPDAFLSSLSSLWDYFKTEEQSLYEEKVQSLTTTAEALTEQLGEKTERTAELYEEYGITEQYQQLQEVNLQISQAYSNYLSLEASIESQTVSQEAIGLQVDDLKRQSAAEIGALSAMASALTGNLELAQSLISQTIDIEFGGIEEQLAATYNLISLYGDLLSSEESKQAAQIEFLLDERSRLLDEEKQDLQNKYDLAITVAQNGGDYNSVLSAISSGASYSEVLSLASPYLEAKSGSGGGGTSSTIATTSGFTSYDIEVDVRSDASELLTAGQSAQQVYDTLRIKYSSNEVSDDALKALLGLGSSTTTQTADETFTASLEQGLTEGIDWGLSDITIDISDLVLPGEF